MIKIEHQRAFICAKTFLLVLLSVTLSACEKNQLCNSAQTSAPPGTAQERHEWAVKTFGIVYQRVEDWTRNSKFIFAQVGNITSVAPIGGPNCENQFFTDGWMGTFRLEVIGEKKAGVFVVNGTHPCEKERTCFNRATWIDETGETVIRDTD